MRVFIALPLPKASADFLAEWTNKFSQTNPSALRQLMPEEMHLTLIPPWQAEADNLKIVKEAIDAVAPLFNPISIKLDTISYKMSGLNPRLVWATGPRLKEAEELRNKIYEHLKKAGSGPVTLQYPKLLTHITLARISGKLPDKFPRKLSEKIGTQGKAAGAAIYESVPLPNGTRYKIIYFREFSGRPD
ncbi:MAG: hypothetical protein M1153_02095 [Patescibacteria group bacterium]|nr:hypothetical protein [Patescibacteria group bacterium]